MNSTQRTPQQALKDAMESGAVQAFADGKNIQYSDLSEPSKWSDLDHYSPHFCGKYLTWRPTPEPKLRPWKPEEVPVGALTRVLKSVNPNNLSRQIITGENGVMAFVCGCPMDLESLMQTREHSLDNGATWLPCGVMEGEK